MSLVFRTASAFSSFFGGAADSATGSGCLRVCVSIPAVSAPRCPSLLPRNLVITQSRNVISAATAAAFHSRNMLISTFLMFMSGIFHQLYVTDVTPFPLHVNTLLHKKSNFGSIWDGVYTYIESHKHVHTPLPLPSLRCATAMPVLLCELL